jgi:signal transduction histidine kinase
MASSRDWRKKAVLILSGVTLVLGAVLTTLAVREAEREKLSRERELDSERQRYGTLIVGEVDSLFSGIENKIMAGLTDSQGSRELQDLADLSRAAAENEDLIGDVFISGPGRGVLFPLRESGYSLAERRRLLEGRLKKIEDSGLFRTAEAAEFKTKNLPLAIQSYRALINTIPDYPSRALISNRLARCLLKSGNAKEAMAVYNTILKEHSNELSSDGVPLGIIALFQIGNIALKTDTERAGEVILEFYDRLVTFEWLLDRSQYQFYRDLIRGMGEAWRAEGHDAKAIEGFARRWDEIDTRAEAKLGELTEEEDLITKAIPLVQARLGESKSENRRFIRFSETIGADLYLISAVSLQDGTILGIRVDDRVLLEEWFPAILERILFPADWLVRIANSDGRVLFGEKVSDAGPESLHAPLVMPFSQGFPPWQIRIVRRDPRAAAKAYGARRNTYVLIALAVTAVLFMGGFTVIRSTAKELALAKLKSEFVSTVSHEFRTPLMSIRYLSEMLDADRVRDDSKKKIYYQKIRKESERLSRLIENMLDFSKIEAGMKKYTHEEFSVKEMIAEVAARFKEYAGDKKISLESETEDGLPNILGDREAISRALFNLLDNAMKYSGRDPQVTLRARTDGQALYLDIRDNGPGIRKEERTKVLEKFYRSTNPEHGDIEGSGIGLTLVDHIARAHGGGVTIESAPGGGTEVTLRLPISQKGKDHGQDLDRRR